MPDCKTLLASHLRHCAREEGTTIERACVVHAAAKTMRPLLSHNTSSYHWHTDALLPRLMRGALPLARWRVGRCSRCGARCRVKVKVNLAKLQTDGEGRLRPSLRIARKDGKKERDTVFKTAVHPRNCTLAVVAAVECHLNRVRFRPRPRNRRR